MPSHKGKAAAGVSALIGLARAVANDGKVTDRELALFVVALVLFVADSAGAFDGPTHSRY